MSTANTSSDLAARQRVDERLDAIDRALLGLLPRCERLEVVAQIETRIGDLTANSTGESSRSTLAEEETFVAPRQEHLIAGRGPRRTNRRLSRVALTAGVLGILALVLLLTTPVVYLIAEMVGEVLDEVVAIALLGSHSVAVAVGGVAAVALGLVALWQLSRRSRNLAGYGWAITGLCTGPLPMLIGVVVVLIFGLELLSLVFVPGHTESAAANLSNDPAPVPSQLPEAKLSSAYATSAAGQTEPAKLDTPATAQLKSLPDSSPLTAAPPLPDGSYLLPESSPPLPSTTEKTSEPAPLPESTLAPSY